MNHPELPSEDVYATVKKIRFVLDHLYKYKKEKNKEIKVLDFGCGNALLLGQYVIKSGYDYVGVDFHKPSIEYARTQYSADNARFLLTLPENEKFDVLLFSEVLEHLDDPISVLKKSKSLLNDDGIIICSIPNGYGLTEIEKYVDKKLGLYQKIRWVVRLLRKVLKKESTSADQHNIPYNIESGHVQFFTTPKLKRVLNEAGLCLKLIQNGSVMGADLTGVTVLRSKSLIKLNTAIANYLPNWAAATWHFVVVKKK